MTSMCKFTDLDGDPVWVNPLQVRMVRSGGDGAAKIEFDDGHSSYVSEAPPLVAQTLTDNLRQS